MIGCLRTRVHKQQIIALYVEFENELKFYTLEPSFNLGKRPNMAEKYWLRHIASTNANEQNARKKSKLWNLRMVRVEWCRLVGLIRFDNVIELRHVISNNVVFWLAIFLADTLQMEFSQ